LASQRAAPEGKNSDINHIAISTEEYLNFTACLLLEID
jgi:hypothetical protein